MKNIILKILAIITALFLFACPGFKENMITLYYSDLSAMNLIPINVNLGFMPDKIVSPDQIELILTELATSRANKKLISCIPEKITFTDIQVDINKKLIELTINSPKIRLGERQESLMIDSVVNTLTEIDKDYSIKFNNVNLESEMDYSEAFQRDAFINQWYTDTNLKNDYSLALVYWLSKDDDSYFVPVTVPILKDDVQGLINVLKKGPEKSAKNYLVNSINKDIEISIKAVNSKHIDIELKDKQIIDSKLIDRAKLAILLTIAELNIFDTVKFITPYGEDKIIDLTKENPKDSINKI